MIRNKVKSIIEINKGVIEMIGLVQPDGFGTR